MSGVSDGQVANESTFDSAYMFANGDTGTIGVVNLNNTSNVDSGVQIVNTQRKINEIADSDGTNGEGDPNRKVYSSTNYIANGDNRKVAIGKLDTQLKLTQDDLDAAEVTIADHESRLDTIESLNSSFSGDKTFNDDVVVQGNFQVNGTTTYVNTTDLEVTDKNITVNKAGNDASSEGAGLTVDRTTTDGSLIYKDASATKWAAGSLGSEVDLVGTTSTQTLTNKTIDGSLNTITNISAANLTGTVAIANGGTGQTTQTAAFDALSPLTTKGDLIVHNNTDNIRLPVGSDGFVLTADSAEASGVKWAATGASGSNDTESSLIENLGITTSVGSNALTINIVQRDGSTPSTGNSAVRVAVRSTPVSTGLYNLRSITSALSLVVSSGSTLGHTSGFEHDIYVYLIDNAGTLELAVSQVLFDDAGLVTTVAEGGAGGADTNNVMYSSTARTNVAFRVVARLQSTQTTAGTWAVVPTAIQLGDYAKLSDTDLVYADYSTAAGQSIPNNTTTIVDFGTKNRDTKGCVNTGSGWAFTAPQSGEYEIQASLMYTNVAWTAGNTIFYNVYVNGTFVRNLYYAPIQASYTDFTPALSGSVKYNLVAGDTVSIRTFQNRGVSTALHADAKYCYVTIQKVG